MLLLLDPIILSVFVLYLISRKKMMMIRKKSFLALQLKVEDQQQQALSAALAARKLPPTSSKNCFLTWSSGMAALYTFTINHIVRNPELNSQILHKRRISLKIMKKWWFVPNFLAVDIRSLYETTKPRTTTRLKHQAWIVTTGEEPTQTIQPIMDQDIDFQYKGT